MDTDTFLLLFGFTLSKIVLAGAIVWLGLRTPEAPGDGDGFGEADPPPRPLLPAAPGRRRPRVAVAARTRPDRSPARRAPRRVRA